MLMAKKMAEVIRRTSEVVDAQKKRRKFPSLPSDKLARRASRNFGLTGLGKSHGVLAEEN